MPKRRFPVTPIGVAYLCDECKKGLAVFKLTTPDGKHRHVCSNCGFNFFLDTKYPTVEWRFPKLEDIQKELIKREEVLNEETEESSASEESSGTADELG